MAKRLSKEAKALGAALNTHMVATNFVRKFDAEALLHEVSGPLGDPAKAEHARIRSKDWLESANQSWGRAEELYYDRLS